VLVDSEALSWNMDPGLLDTAIQTCLKDGIKPKAIIGAYLWHARPDG